jgi:hypothetical protein
MVYYMGLIRLLTYLAVGYFLWLTVKNYLRKQEQRQANAAQKKPQSPARIVQCQHCGVHLPETDALAASERWFCNNEHQQRWLLNQKG